MAAGPEQVMGLAVSDLRVEPVPRISGEDEVESPGLTLPLLERRRVDLESAARQIAACVRGELLAQLDADDGETAVEQRTRRLARFAADLEQPIAGLQPRETDEI